MKRLGRRTMPVLAMLFASAASAQEPEEPPVVPGIEDLVPRGGQSSPQQEMIRLFHRVEARMKEMGSYLLDAGAGDTSKLERMAESGIEELLRSAQPNAKPSGGIGDLLTASRAQGEGILEDIDRILKLAAENGGQCSSCASGEGSSPKDGQPTPEQGGQPQNKGKEETPEGPAEKPGGQEPQDGEEPRGNQHDPDASDKRPGEQPEYETQDPLHVIDGAEQWGNLPVHLRELFRAEGGQQLPARYRDWIDSYYRRLNRRSGD